MDTPIPTHDPFESVKAIGAILKRESATIGAVFKPPRLMEQGIACSYSIYVEANSKTFYLHLSWTRSEHVRYARGTIGNGSMSPDWDLELLHGDPTTAPLGWNPHEAVPTPPYRWGMYPKGKYGQSLYLGQPPTEILTAQALRRELRAMLVPRLPA